MPTLADVYQRRWNNFDVLRFGLAAAVIWSHCYALAGLAMDPVFAFTRQIDAGSLAVDCFFVLSGFLITQSWVSDPTLGDYAVKRALRLVPALVVALAFGTLIVGPMVTRMPLSTYFTSWDTWAHFGGVVLHRHLGSPLLFPDNPLPSWLNTSLWSLRYEVFCYALIAGFGLALGTRWMAVVPVVLIASLVGQMLFAATGQAGGLPGVPETTFRLVACFFAGSTLFVARDRVPFGPLLAAGAAALLLASAWFGGFRYVFPVAGSYLLLFLAIWPRLPLQRFGRYGDFSYGLYVFAYPIQQAIVQVVGPAIPIPLFFLLAFAPTLLLAALSWHFVEAPALARKPRKRQEHATEAAPCPTSASGDVSSHRGVVMRSPSLSVVIPAYNEAQRLPPSLLRVMEYLEQRRTEFEILVVDDGSTDGTPDVAEAILAPLGERGRVLRNPSNLGKGASVRRGMLAARGSRVLFSDADLSTPIEEVEKLERALGEGAGVAIGSRAVDRALIEQRQSWPRDVIGRLFNLVVRVFAVRGIHDTQCGFKLFAGDAVAPIFARARIDRFGFDVEILTLAQCLGIAIAEVPVRWRNNPDSRVTVGQGARAFLDPVRVRGGLLFGRYHLRGTTRRPGAEPAPARLSAGGR